jgi:predicted nucleic acid-binding protein
LNTAREQRYHWITSTFAPIPFDTRTARGYGALCASVHAIGRNPRPRRFALLIAAAAVALRIPLVMRNETDFRGIHSSLNIIAVQ